MADEKLDQDADRDDDISSGHGNTDAPGKTSDEKAEGMLNKDKGEPKDDVGK
ncbi:hypothetical protein [Nigerium massiliense]|uniref:hypothetical protein n=1 Tax=Nigerium massiliense TaxID=1522317 RepID=UPI0012FD8671|nr:hypothetical protein [Nigerium massiliense]